MNAGEGYSEDRLPWLETVEDDYEQGPSLFRIALLVALGLAVIAAAIGGYLWYQRSASGEGTGALINAQEGDYKVKPDEPGGMKVEGEGDTVFAASEGATTNGSVDVSAVPEAPVAGKAAPKASPTPTKGASRVIATVPTTSLALPTASTQKSPAPRRSAQSSSSARSRPRLARIPPGRASRSGSTISQRSAIRSKRRMAKELCGRLKAAAEGHAQLGLRVRKAPSKPDDF